MNLYPEIVNKLELKIDEDKATTVIDIWNVFKSICKTIDFQKNSNVQSFGIQSECYLSSEFSNPSFYFAMHYQLEYEIEAEEYCHMEHVYCEFDLTEYNISELINDCFELWNYDYSFDGMFEVIENWDVFNSIKNAEIKFKVHGTEL